jgi:hypothetical protein
MKFTIYINIVQIVYWILKTMYERKNVDMVNLAIHLNYEKRIIKHLCIPYLLSSG